MPATSTPPKHSPIKTPPRRQAGEGLRQNLFETFDFYIIYALATAGTCILMTILVWFLWYQNPRLIPGTVTFFTVLIITTMSVEGYRRFHRAKKIQLGLDGERSVADTLDQLRIDGYEVLHDIPSPDGKANTDHVVIGPAGVFAIETKTRSKNDGRKNEVHYDGRRVRVNGADRTDEVFKQARACRDDITRRIRAHTGLDIPVRAIVVYPGWWVNEPKGRGGPNDIWVLNPERAVHWIQISPRGPFDESTARLIAMKLVPAV